jgi:hypothetical protein
MPDTAVAPTARISAVFAALAAVAILLGSAATLWAYYGTAVFYEMVVAGLAYCF